MKRSDRIIQFIETLRLPDGTQAGELVVLRDWQKEIIRESYDPSDDEGKKLVRQVVLSMARKNAKTALVSFLAICHLCGPEAIRNGQLYSLSVDREQASILFNYTKNIIYMDDELSKRLNVTESRKHIIDPVSGSIYSVLSGEKKGKMGKSSSFIAFDELAEFGADRTLYDALLTSTGAHDEPMIWTFSTQAPDDHAVLSELIDYGEKIKSGELPPDQTFKSFLYAVPRDQENIWDEDVWKIANPGLDDFRSIDEMRDFAKKAQRMPSMEMAFRNLYLNQRVSSSKQFISPDVWKENGGEPDLTLFEDRVCFGGLDLSAKNDLTALIFVTQDDDMDIHAMSLFWTPGDNIKDRSDRDRVPYDIWAKQGKLFAPPGKVIDYRYVAKQITELHGKMNISGIKFDRWRIDDMVRELEKEGVSVWVEGRDEEIPGGLRLIPHGQGFKDMTPAVERLEDLLVQGKIRHGNHPVMTMCASNTRVQSDPAGGRKFDKIKSTGRIDGIVALSMAICPSMVEVEPEKSIYNTRGVLTF